MNNFQDIMNILVKMIKYFNINVEISKQLWMLDY